MLFRSIQISRSDVQSVYAGLRPLVKTSNSKSTALASRDHTIIVSKSDLITVTGGKWTTYRKMAKDALNNAVFVAKLPTVKCATRNLHLHGYRSSVQYGNIFSSYGSDLDGINEIIASNPAYTNNIHPDYPYSEAELIWAVRNEMALQVEDILARRSRMLFVNARAAIDAAPKVARMMAKLLGRDDQWIENQINSFNDVASAYITS